MSNQRTPAVAHTGASHTLVVLHARCRSDDGGLKHDKLNEWAQEIGGNGDKLVWLDKSCIDQLNIDANLRSLPIFLSGCQQLLMLVGPTCT